MSNAPRWAVGVSVGVIVMLVLAFFVAKRLANPPRKAFPSSAVGSSHADADEERVIVRGTVLDAQSSEPLSDVEVVAPNGTKTRSDSAGRFEFVDLPEELSGPLTATAKDGATAENRLRPLRPGVLEVVLRLRAP